VRITERDARPKWPHETEVRAGRPFTRRVFRANRPGGWASRGLCSAILP